MAELGPMATAEIDRCGPSCSAEKRTFADFADRGPVNHLDGLSPFAATATSPID